MKIQSNSIVYMYTYIHKYIDVLCSAIACEELQFADDLKLYKEFHTIEALFPNSIFTNILPGVVTISWR